MASLTASKYVCAVLVMALMALSAAPLGFDNDRAGFIELPAKTLQEPGTGNVNVTVTSDAERLLPGVKLTLEGIATPQYTDSNGTAAFLDVPADLEGVIYELRANLTGYNDVRLPVTVYENQTADVEVVLQGGIIFGVVTDQSDRIINATVSLASPSLTAWTSDLDGTYALAGLPGGSHVVTASAEGYRPQTKNVYLQVGSFARQDFSLTPIEGWISGNVYHAVLGSPLSNVSVSVEVGSLILTATSNTAGSYNISSVPEGTYTVTAQKTGYNTGIRTGITVTRGNGTEGVDLTLTEKPSRLYGVVRSGTLLLVGVNVSVVGTSFYNLSGPDGSYEIRNLTAGVYNLIASAVGYQTMTAGNLTITLGGEIQQNFNMIGLPGAILRGKVYVADSQEPLTNAQITIVNLRPQPISRATNIYGEFEFAGLAAGTYTIHVEKTGFRPIEVSNILVTEEEPVDLTLELTPLREAFEGFIFGFDMAHSMMILALVLTIIILAVAVYLRVRSFQTPESAPAILDESEEEGELSETGEDGFEQRESDKDSESDT